MLTAMPDRSGELSFGFRVKSGFAVMVALAGPAASPAAIARRIVLLSDPTVEETRQPYHDGFGTAQENLKEIARLTRIVERCASRSIDELLADSVFAARRWRGAGLVVGSVIDPASVGNPHIRAHANEGRLFRVVLEASLARRGVSSSVIVEKELGARAVATLKRPAAEIKKVVAALGARLGGPWRAEEKAAATAAWMEL